MSYNHIEPQSLNDHNYVMTMTINHIWKNITYHIVMALMWVSLNCRYWKREKRKWNEFAWRHKYYYLGNVTFCWVQKKKMTLDPKREKERERRKHWCGYYLCLRNLTLNSNINRFVVKKMIILQSEMHPGVRFNPSVAISAS